MDILIDWGSSNFRAFLVDGDQIVDRRTVANQGTLKASPNADFETRGDRYSQFLSDTIHPWLEEYRDAPIIMCGAIGGREGWVETKYAEAPAGFVEIAANLNVLLPEQKGRFANRELMIVPGVARVDADGRHDIMRSEEIKSLGALAYLNKSEGVLCIPGTHCKWVNIVKDKIISFHTMMTGEFYGLLSEGGSLAPLFKNVPSMRDVTQHYQSFDAGLKLAKDGRDLLADIWQVRSQKMHADHPPHSLQSFLSGILIGHEMREMQQLYPSAEGITLVSDPGMRQIFYQRAAKTFGISVRDEINSETAVCQGLIMTMAERGGFYNPCPL